MSSKFKKKLFLFIRKVMLTFLINKTHCTQIYYINLAHEQIYGKPKRKFKISANDKAFRFVLDYVFNLRISSIVKSVILEISLICTGSFDNTV